MNQKFSSEIYEKFKNEFNIKENPSKIDLDFLEKTRKYSNYIKYIPWIKMVWVGNSISMNAGTSDSDIDLFIVSSQNRIWIVRILVTFIFQILGLRKTEKKHAWRFCLSFFATEKALDFSNFAIKNDVYLYFRIIYFKPILDFDNTYDKFIKANSSWANFSEYQYIIDENKKSITLLSRTNTSSSQDYHLSSRAKSRDLLNRFLHFTSIQSKWQKILNQLEKLLKKIFLKKTIKTYEKLKKPFWVIINNDMLKFHDKDIRKDISKNLV